MMRRPTSFEEAAHLDPDMAMAYWGIALSLGPNINQPEDIDRGKTAYAAITKAKSLEANASAPEREYIDALALRYAPDGTMNDALQLAYANAMREVAHRNPDDPDAGALFAEAMMDLHPWGLWTSDGKPVEGTPEIVATLEGVHAKYPDHLGANHYYIHAVEASSDPGRALASAERLPKLAPAAGHIVHMPSHIYLSRRRLLRFRQRQRCRDQGRQGLSARAQSQGHLSGDVRLAQHSLPVGLVHDGRQQPRRVQSVARTRRCGAARDGPAMPMAESMSPTRYFTEARFGKWDAILKEPTRHRRTDRTRPAYGITPAASRLWRRIVPTTRSMKKRNSTRLSRRRRRIASWDSIRSNRLLAMGSATLAGEIDSANGHHDDAIKHLKEAVAIQDALNYEEPPPWYYPVRETLGMELLAEGKTADAEQVFRDDLKQNPENGWSLNGLAICLRARNASEEAASVDARLKKAWAHADVTLPPFGAPVDKE